MRTTPDNHSAALSLAPLVAVRNGKKNPVRLRCVLDPLGRAALISMDSPGEHRCVSLTESTVTVGLRLQLHHSLDRSISADYSLKRAGDVFETTHRRRRT